MREVRLAAPAGPPSGAMFDQPALRRLQREVRRGALRQRRVEDSHQRLRGAVGDAPARPGHGRHAGVLEGAGQAEQALAAGRRARSGCAGGQRDQAAGQQRPAHQVDGTQPPVVARRRAQLQPARQRVARIEQRMAGEMGAPGFAQCRAGGVDGRRSVEVRARTRGEQRADLARLGASAGEVRHRGVAQAVTGGGCRRRGQRTEFPAGGLRRQLLRLQPGAA
jgi:hypothetical protein